MHAYLTREAISAHQWPSTEERWHACIQQQPQVDGAHASTQERWHACAYSSSPRSMVRMYDVFSRSNSSHLR
jgi:hypothetical protein